jgi:hypothetical protein
MTIRPAHHSTVPVRKAVQACEFKRYVKVYKFISGIYEQQYE